MSEVYPTELQVVQADYESAKAKLAFRQSLLRLKANADFRLVFEQGFFLHEAARFAKVSGDPDIPESARANALRMAQAAGDVERYLETLLTASQTAERDVRDYEVLLDEARAADGAE